MDNERIKTIGEIAKAFGAFFTLASGLVKLVSRTPKGEGRDVPPDRPDTARMKKCRRKQQRQQQRQSRRRGRKGR